LIEDKACSSACNLPNPRASFAFAQNYLTCKCYTINISNLGSYLTSVLILWIDISGTKRLVSQHLLLQKGALESVLVLQFLIDLPAVFGYTVSNQQSCLAVLIHSFSGKTLKPRCCGLFICEYGDFLILIRVILCFDTFCVGGCGSMFLLRTAYFLYCCSSLFLLPAFLLLWCFSFHVFSHA